MVTYMSAFGLLYLSFLFVFEGQCISIQPAPLLPICATVLCAFPDCLNPIPPGHGQCCPTCPPADVCNYNENVYQVGDVFPADDGCNKCTCSSGGLVACTKIFCPEPTTEPPPPPTCPPDKPLVFCFADPCMFATCPAHPDAVCVADYCGGCNARFFIGKKEVTDTCKCPVTGQIFKECGSACPANCTTPNPICTRQCVARCECSAGQVIDEKKNECVPRDQCPAEVCVKDGVTYQVGDTFPAGDECNTCTCQAGGQIACTEIACPDVCVQGEVIYEVGDNFPAGDGCNNCGCIRPNTIVCTLIACPEPTTELPPPPTCPPDKPLVSCFADPCMFATCPAHPDAVCVADFCGGCNARFFIGKKEVTDTCKCPVKGQIFKECGSACPANCTTPNPICTRQCVARCECPAGQVIDEKKNECVPRDQCPDNCPPVCTAAFCKRNKWAKCTMPGPREIPGCTGTCQFTFCSACYFSEEPRPLPGYCPLCGGPISSVRCYKRWAYCIGRADAREYEDTADQTEDNFRCYRYPCPLKG
ncbi:kielin/chordin-like protein [Halichondria panicea]|uniref:kielin/chordin-like protein n=1 Tax=Halichondria panicea TaxID=6063 RepID=UPI00312B77F2